MPSHHTSWHQTGRAYGTSIFPRMMLLITTLLLTALFAQTLYADQKSDGDIQLPSGFEYPNGITHAPDGTIFVGSVTKGDIVSIKPDGSIRTVFRETEDVFAGTALRYDPQTHILWAASPDFVGKQVDGKTVRRPHRVAAIDISKGKVVWSAAIPDKGFANDIALDGKGGVYITDSFQDRVLHLTEPGADFKTVAKSPLMSPGDLGPAGIVKISEDTLIIGLWRDGTILHVKMKGNGKSEVRPVKLERPVENPDGMALTADGRLLLLEGGVSSGNGKLLLIDLKQNAPHKITVLLDKLDTPLNLTVHKNIVALTEGRVRHFIIKDDPTIKVPKSFRVIKFKLDKE